MFYLERALSETTLILDGVVQMGNLSYFTSMGEESIYATLGTFTSKLNVVEMI